MRSYHIVAAFPVITSVSLLIALSALLDGCCGPICQMRKSLGTGGGQDSLTVDLPFAAGYQSQCVQGAGGSYSHHYDSTRYDVDLDTPNSVDDPVYAPASGLAYVHDGDRDNGFGVHVNIDQGDGTYLVLGHLDEVFIDDATEVARGQLLGFEGTTGASTGDHVHLGRHDGNAENDAIYGDSIEGLAFSIDDLSSGEYGATQSTSEMVCDLSTGHRYASRLETPLWHPAGSLVKTPGDPTVYLLEGERRNAFWNEEAFWSRGYDFAEVALIDDAELACYTVGNNITGQNDVSAAYDGSKVWLLEPGRHARQAVAADGWQAVLKSWGITAATYDDLALLDNSAESYAATTGYAPFRDGSLVSETNSSAVYVISEEIAMPIETWEVYLLLGFAGRSVIEVDDGLVNAVMGRVGDCSTDAYCLSQADVVTCGGPDDTEAAYDSETDPDVPSDTGDGQGSDAPVDDTLSLSWTMPASLPAERITISGEYTSGGIGQGWTTFAEVAGGETSTLTTGFPGAAPGDSLRFSVEFEQGGVTSWSCLAPYPPGVVQGSVAAVWGEQALSVAAADDPTSNGCGLVVTIPH